MILSLKIKVVNLISIHCLIVPVLECTNQQSHPKTPFAVGTIISVAMLGLIVLILTVGALYGYCQIGRFILATRGDIFMAEKESPRQETKI